MSINSFKQPFNKTHQVLILRSGFQLMSAIHSFIRLEKGSGYSSNFFTPTKGEKAYEAIQAVYRTVTIPDSCIKESRKKQKEMTSLPDASASMSSPEPNHNSGQREYQQSRYHAKAFIRSKESNEAIKMNADLTRLKPRYLPGIVSILQSSSYDPDPNPDPATLIFFTAFFTSRASHGLPGAGYCTSYRPGESRQNHE